MNQILPLLANQRWRRKWRFQLITFIALGSMLASIVAFAQTTSTRPASRQPSTRASKDALDEVLTTEVQDRLGLGKLNEEERTAMAELLARSAVQSDLCRVASAYLRKEGWEKVAVSRTQRAQLDEFDRERRWIVVDIGVHGKWAIEAPLLWGDLPGIYWGKPGVITGLERILDGSGSEYEFLFEKQKQLR